MQQRIPNLMRFLSEDAARNQDFLDMEPATDADSGEIMKAKKTPLAQFNEIKQKTVLDGEFCQRVCGGNEFLVLLSCNTDSGMVCGLGLSKNVKTAKHYAAKQVLERVKWMHPLEQLSNISEEYESAGMAAEALEVLSEQIGNPRMTLVQPFGTSWRAILQAQFQGRLIYGGSKGTCVSQEEAGASAGDAFLQQLRFFLRVPKDAAHAPEEWRDALHFEEVRQNMKLQPLCSKAVQASLLEALEGGEELETLQEALKEASKRQEARIAESEVMSESLPDMEDYEGVVARRIYEVTKPEDEDWRREEIKGKLPAEQVREEISRVLEYNKTVVVSGGTGSGKSTQLPQFILDDWRGWELKEQEAGEGPKLEVDGLVEVEYEEVWYRCKVLEVADDNSTITAKYFDGGDEEPDIDVKSRVRAPKPRWASEPPRIVVTQPRRIAALSLAERVAWERFGEVGGEIGHSIRGNTILPNSDEGTVEFCTIGTLLRRVVNDPLLSRYNVVILDEVHERDIMTDFLLILMREVISKRPDLRMVLMSATLDVQTFVNYLPGCAVVEVPCGTRYPVEEIHLEDDFFKNNVHAKELLRLETEGRDDDEPGVGQHEFGAGLSSDITTELQEEVQELLKDKEMARYWEQYANGALGGELDPAKHTAFALRSFLARVAVKDEDEEEALSADTMEPPSEVLLEQIKQLGNYSDEMRQAWAKHSKGREKEEEWEASELLAFLKERGVRPWTVERGSWELTSSRLWWGSDNNGTKLLLAAAEWAILRMIPEMLQVSEEDEFGVGAVLCFLPGWAEIRTLAESLETSHAADDLWVLKLHSTVSREEQMAIFEQAPDGKVKVILSTNIAESSVTINDVRVVVDSGLHRETAYDPKRRLSTLETVWICQSNAVQRKGRAGRVRSGRVLRLYSRAQFESVPWRPAPEMQRCNLSQTCLQTVSLGRDPRAFLAKAPDPPSVALVESAIAELVCIDAIVDGLPPRMLPVGQVLCRMPLEPLLGRAMILGTLFGVPQMTAALLAVSIMRSPFIPEPGNRMKVVERAREFCPWSDTVAILRAVMQYEKLCKERGEATARSWAEFHALNSQRLSSSSRIRFQLLQDVQKSGLLDDGDLEGENPDDWMEQDGGGYDDGVIFEAQEAEASLQRQEWLTELGSTDLEVQDERLLLGILCSAYPTNLAVREKPHLKKHTTNSGTAVLDKMSVNSTVGVSKEEEQLIISGLETPSWWLYSDSRVFNSQTTLGNITALTAWHVALFGGLRARDQPQLELDGWINVSGRTNDTEVLVGRLRQEVRQALIWVAISTSWDRVARAATQRSKALLSLLGMAIVGQDPSEEQLAELRDFKLPQLEEGEATLQADEDMDREELEQQLWKKTVVELRVLLKEMGAKASGRKAELVERCASSLLGVDEESFESFNWA